LDKFIKYFYGQLGFFIVLILILSVISYVPTYNYIVDIISQFKIQYLFSGIFALFCYILASFKTSDKLPKLFCILSLTTIVLNIFDISKNYTYDAKTISMTGNQIKIAHFNVLTTNKSYDKIIIQLELENPDILLLEEINENWTANIKIISLLS